MNRNAYNNGQATRKAINSGAVATKDAVAATGVAIGSFIKGLFSNPAPAAKPKAAKRPARRTQSKAAKPAARKTASKAAK